MVHAQTVKTTGGTIGTSTQAALELSSPTSLGTTTGLLVDLIDDNAVNGYGFFVSGNATPSLGNTAKHTQISTGDEDSRLTLKCGDASDFAPRLQMISGNDIGVVSRGSAIFDYGSRNFDASTTAFFAMRYMPMTGSPIEMIRATTGQVLLAHQTGSVGVGTTSPQELLHVAGTIRSDSLAGTGIRNVSADADGNLIISAASGNGASTLDDLTDVSVAGAANGQALVFNGTSWVPQTLTGNANTTWTQGIGVVYNETDKVGIGIRNPEAGLTILGQDSSTARIVLGNDGFNDTYAGRLAFHEDVDGVAINDLCGFEFNHNGMNNSLYLTSGCPDLDTIIVFERGGNIGMGISDPSSGLQVGYQSLFEEDVTLNDELIANAKSTFNDHSVHNRLSVGIGDTADYPLQADNSIFSRTISATGSTPSALLHVIHAEVTHNNGQDSRAVYGESTPVDYHGYGGYFRGGYRGVYGVVTGQNGGPYTGVYGLASGQGTCRGVYGSAFNASVNYGGFFTHFGGTAGTGTSTGDYAIYSNGSSYATGTWYSGSDRRFKENVESLDNALDIINQLNPTTYSFKQTGKYSELNFPIEKQYGFIAQEVEQVLPEIVRDVKAHFNDQDEDKFNDYSEEYKGMNYTALISVLTQGIKEQQAIIESQKEEIESLKVNEQAQNEQIENLKANEKAQEARIDQIETLLTGLGLSDETTTTPTASGTHTDNNQLFQNRPNPFSQTTEIPYYLEENVQAQIVVYEMRSGTIVRTFDLQGQGHGKVSMESSNLSQGAYSYGLIVNGQQIASKIMVLAN